MMPRRLAMALFAGAALLVNAACLAAGDDDPELVALLDLLEAQTTLATQTRMNADYVPGMVTVLQGDDLRIRGIPTVGEALGQVAGFHVTVNNVGDTRAIVRGIGATLGATNLKVMLDGVVANRATDGSADWVMRLPVTQVERIEVIRGPGSALYGGFAFSGVVNVLTRDGNAVGLGAGSDDARRGDVRLDQALGGAARLRLRAGGWRTSDSGRQTLPDNFAANGLGYSPGQVFDGEHGRYALAAIEASGYALQMRHAVMVRGGGYGRTAAIPDGLAPRRERVSGLTASKTWMPSDRLEIAANASVQETDLEQAAYIPIPAGAGQAGSPSAQGIESVRRTGNTDQLVEAEVAAHWRAGDAQRLYVGLSHARSRVSGSFATLELPDGHVEYLTPNRTPVVAGSNRTLTSLTVQDQLQLHEQVEVTLGLRHDDYDDWGGKTSPRLAAVWRAGDHHIVKLQYAEAFRPPTLEEFYPGPDTFPGATLTGDLNEERIRSLEAAYIYRRADRRMRLTAYRTQVQDLIEFFINPGSPPVWRNRGNVEVQGLELEWVQRVDRHLQWWANLAYADATDHLDVDERLLGAVDWLVSAGASWRTDGHLTHALGVTYVGEQEGWEIRTRVPNRARFDAYATLDYTVTLSDPEGIDGFTVRGGIRNLTDQSYESVATPAQFPGGLTHGGRELWLAAEYRF